MSLFNEIECWADANAPEPELVEVKKISVKENMPASAKIWSKAFLAVAGHSDHVKLASGCLPRLAEIYRPSAEAGTVETGRSAYR